jgi:hypothetical protein
MRLPTGGVALLNPRLHARIPIGMQLDVLELHHRKVPFTLPYGDPDPALAAKCHPRFALRKAGILSGCGAMRSPTGGVASLNPRLQARIPIGMQLDVLELHHRKVPFTLPYGDLPQGC